MHIDHLPFDVLIITDLLACESLLTQLHRSELCPRVALLIRDKQASQAEVAQAIQGLQPMIRSSKLAVLVHTHVHLALEFGLAGVHVASNTDLGKVRSQLPSGFLLGASRHSQDPLDQADIGLADYATISPIYRPTSKPDDTRIPLGLSGLQSCIQRSVRPLVALGGMQPGRVAGAIAAGAKAIAISGAILQTEQPAIMAQQLCEEIDIARATPGYD